MFQSHEKLRFGKINLDPGYWDLQEIWDAVTRLSVHMVAPSAQK